MPARLVTALLLLLLSAVSTTAAQEVTLRFAWPRGTEAEVRITQLQDQVAVGQPQTVVMEAHHDIVVRDHPQGLLVDWTNARNTSFHATPELREDDPLRIVLERVGAHASDDIVSDDGEFLEVGDLEEITRAMREVVQPALDSLEGRPGFQEAKAMADALTSEEQHVIGTQDVWAAQTGLWAGRTMTVGQPVQVDWEAASPLAPGQQIPMTVELLLAGYVSCPGQTDGRDCVRLELTAAGDSGALEDAYRDVLTRSGYPVGAPMPVTGLSHTTRATIVAQPETLLPYTCEISKVVEGTINRGSFTQGLRVQERVEMEYTY